MKLVEGRNNHKNSFVRKKRGHFCGLVFIRKKEGQKKTG